MNIAQAITARMTATASAPDRAKKPAKMPIVAHRMFAPVLGLWGAVCGALCAAVLPPSLAYAIGQQVLPAAGWAWAQPAIAVGAAGVLGLLCYAFAKLVTHRHHQRRAGGDLEPIDAAHELGSESFDAPLCEDGVADKTTPPHEYDLAEFAALPGRDAVWVAEPFDIEDEDIAPAAQAPQPLPQQTSIPAVPAAVAKLRAVPPAELSLCQMVERFAAALQEYQIAQDHEPAEQSREQREAVLGEALKALDTITRKGMAELEPSHSDAAPTAGSSQVRGAA